MSMFPGRTDIHAKFYDSVVIRHHKIGLIRAPGGLHGGHIGLTYSVIYWHNIRAVITNDFT